MPEGSQITPVDDIVHSNQKLEEKARDLTSKDVVLDQKETFPETFTTTDSSICAVLVTKHSAGGLSGLSGLAHSNQCQTW
ncbi:hypothetical protein ACJ73_05049 [Blastomyces percursus]|uniref:Uncharacterized protein n=1 Tax=Blastomyces percursus TaxID=1658174 RepID=A0A1J9R7H8_9EURO|nr:hypothetical protein ACJ73_05049 [Blastomyces percursus]